MNDRIMLFEFYKVICTSSYALRNDVENRIFFQQACGFWYTNDGAVVECSVEAIKKVLAAGLVPVLHGDAVIDLYKGTNILSGDTIVEVRYLAISMFYVSLHMVYYFVDCSWW